MTVYDKAEIIAAKGMIEEEVFQFFRHVDRDIVELITLFNMFEVSMADVWNLYEKWQGRG